MLVICIEDGLTVGSKVYRKGDVFKLSDVQLAEVGDSSDEQIARKQTRIYGKPFYRRATSEEIINAHTRGIVDNEMLDAREKRIVGKAILARKRKEREIISLVSPEELAQIEAEEEKERAELEKISESLAEEPAPKQAAPKRKPTPKKKTTRRKPLESKVTKEPEPEEVDEPDELETEEGTESDE